MGKAKECLKVVALLLFCIGVPVIGWALVRIVRHSPDSTAPNPTYAELVTILLTGVTIVLAVLAAIIAILAVWGYQSIKGEAASAADRAVKTTVEAVVAKHANDDRVKAILRKELIRVFGATVQESAAYTEAFSADIADAQPTKVGTDYPKGDADEG